MFRTGTVDLPAWVVLPLWFLEQIFFAGLAGSSGVAYRAHVGGFLFGFVAALAIKQLRIEEKYIAPKIEKQISVSQNPALEDGMDLLLKGDLEGARRSFAKVLAAEPRNADAHLGIWQSHCQEGTPEAGAEHLVRVIDEEVRRGEHALALDHWRELVVTAHETGPAALRWRLAGSLATSDSRASVEILRNIASDPAAGLLAEKAARQLAAFGETALPSAPPPPAAPPPPPPPFWEAPPRDSPSDAETRPKIEICEVEALQPDGLLLRGAGGGSDLLPYAEVEKLVVAGIAAKPKPFLVLDLLLARSEGQPRRVERLLSTEFDPRHLVGRLDMSGLDAFREVVKVIADGAGAQVFPSGLLAPSTRIPTFETLDAYERVELGPRC